VLVKLPTIAEVLQPSLLPKRPSLLQDAFLLKASPFAGSPSASALGERKT